MGDFESWAKRSDEELIQMVLIATRDNPNAVGVERILHVRNGKRQLAAGNALVQATKQLATATWMLVIGHSSHVASGCCPGLRSL